MKISHHTVNGSMHKWLKITLALVLSASALGSHANENAWVAPVSSYINLQSAPSTNATQPIVTQPDGNPLSALYDSQAFVARVVLGSSNDAQTVELSLDGVNWLAATLVSGAYEYDFGLLSIGDHNLLVRVNTVEQTPTPFSVTEQIFPPERVTGVLGPNEAGKDQAFQITWDAMDGAQTYTALLKSGAAGEAVLQKIEDIEGTTVSFTHNNAEVIIVRIQGCNTAGCGLESGARIVNVLANVPAVVTGLNVPTQAYVDESFNVNWASASGATSYKVYINNSLANTVNTTSADLTRTNVEEIDISIAACNSVGCASPSTAKVVNIVVDPNAPIANNDEGQLQVLSTHTFDVLTNDNDPNSSALTIAEISTAGQKGTATIINNGKAISYNNTVGACGGVNTFTDSIGYKVSNAEGLLSQPATLSITINCQAEGNWVQLPVPFNTQVKDYKLYTGTNDYYLKALPNSWLFVGKLMVPTFDQYSFIRMFKQDDIWQAELATVAEFTANVVSLAIPDALGQITDLNAADWYSVNINADLDIAPTAVDDVAVYQWNTSLDVAVIGNDIGPAPLGMSVLSVSIQPTLGQAVIDEERNLIVYTPNTDSCEDDSFEYVIENSNKQQSNALVNLSCSQILPTAVDDNAVYEWNTALDIAVIDNDLAPEPLTLSVLSIATQAMAGLAEINVEGNLITYTPNSDSCVDDSFEYVIENSQMQQSTATVTLSCEPSFAKWQSATVNVGETAYLSWSVPEAESCTVFHANTDYSNPVSGVDEAFIFYTPGNVTMQCFYLNGDIFEGPLLQVNESYIAPTAIDDTARYRSNTSVVIDVLSNDTQLMVFGIDEPTFTQPQYGTVVLDNYQLVYTPNAESCEADSFAYTLTNSFGSATAQVTLTCSDTRWSSEEVSVGEAVTIVWDEPEALSCSAGVEGLSYPNAGEAELSFYVVGDVNWQCTDINEQIIKTVTLTVNKLPAPSHLDKQTN